jgi:hypothetical protein
MNQPQEPDLTPQPNRILATPDTVEQCRTELRTPTEQTIAAGAARDQAAFARINAAR